MTRLLGLFALFCIVYIQVLAQQPEATAPADSAKVSYWKKNAQLGINFNQASFSGNWKGGGVNSIAIGGILKARADYNKNNISFINQFSLEYGMVRNAGQDLRKNADRIFFDSKFGYKFSNKWNFYASLNLLTQFDLGYKYDKDPNTNQERALLISRFFAPAFITESLGVEYRPDETFFMRFGTGTMRQTIVRDTTLYRNEPKNYGVKIGEKVRNEIAFQIVTQYKKEIAKNLFIDARYQLFANYNNITAVDNRLDVVLTAKVNKFVNTTLTGVVLYDDDMDSQVQYSQILALGFLVVLDQKQ